MLLVLGLVVCALILAACGLMESRPKPVEAPLTAEYRDTFTLKTPYVKYVNGRKATKYVL